MKKGYVPQEKLILLNIYDSNEGQAKYKTTAKKLDPLEHKEAVEKALT